MFLVIYQKSNGEILERKRNTFPNYAIGEYTSMGWLVLDIRYKYKNKYYTSSDYYKIKCKRKKYNFRSLRLFLKKYATTILLIIIIILYLFK